MTQDIPPSQQNCPECFTSVQASEHVTLHLWGGGPHHTSQFQRRASQCPQAPDATVTSGSLSFYDEGRCICTQAGPSTGRVRISQPVQRRHEHKGTRKMTLTFGGAGGIMRGCSRKAKMPLMESTDPSSAEAMRLLFSTLQPDLQ